MCEESNLVRHYRDLQSGPNKFLDTRYLTNKDRLINRYPQVYFQVVFHYFRFDLEVSLEPTIKSVTRYLNDFGWLPLALHKLRNPDERAAEMERLFTIFKENDFYRTNANSLSDRSEDEVEIAFSSSSKAEAIAKLLKPSGQVANQIAIPIYGTGVNGGLVAHFGDLYNYLKNRMDMWSLMSKKMRDGHRYLYPETIYQVRTSFALTLYQTFLYQVEQMIPWFMDEIGRPERMPSLTEAAFEMLNRDQSALDQTIRFAFGVLRQSSQMADQFCPSLPEHCLTYLKRIRLFSPAWNVAHLNQIPTEFAQVTPFVRHYRKAIDRQLLPQGWAHFMQQFNIVPAVDKLTNGVLVDLFMETINSERSNKPQVQQQQSLTEFDVRNQMIWFVALVPDHFRSLHKALFPGLPLPCNYPWYP